MSALLLTLGHKTHSLACFEEYREEEKHGGSQCSVERGSGALKEYHTLELRLNPPQISIDNDCDNSATVLCIDSANRSGTLVEVRVPETLPVTGRMLGSPFGRTLTFGVLLRHPQVVQHMLALALQIRRARISSDGGWFVDGELPDTQALASVAGGWPSRTGVLLTCDLRILTASCASRSL